MRVSIWQQWASNHSAAFTVMGKFRTVEDAQRVGGILKGILTEVARWKQQDREAKWQAYLAAHQIQHPTPADEERFDNEYYGSEFTPEATEIERQLAEQYDVLWPDTLQYARDPETAPKAVVIVDRAVIVAEDLIDDYTWTGFWPFEELISKFGGEVAVEFEHGGLIQVTIPCTAPDETKAAQLLHHVQLGESNSWNAGLIRVDDLVLESVKVDSWISGRVTRDGLQLTYIYREVSHGRYFAALLEYLRAHGCTIIDYTFETLETE